MFFKRHFNASQEDRALGEVGGGQKAWTDHGGWALSWGLAERSCSQGHREGSWPAARASTSAGPTGLRWHQEGPGPVPGFKGGSRSHCPGRLSLPRETHQQGLLASDLCLVLQGVRKSHPPTHWPKGGV